MIKLTEGQLAIRQIIIEYLEEYLSIDATNYDEKNNLYKKIQNIFQSRPEIVNDPVTGRYEGYKDISHRYISYLYNLGQQETIKNNFPDISFHSFIYGGGGSDDKRKLFMGGYYWNTTFWALFTLAQGQTVPMEDADIAYYQKSGIVTYSSNGSHRALAHILWGESKIAPRSMILIHEFPHLNNDLNKALLILENSEIKPYINFNYRSTNEIDKIKRFTFEATECEKKTITEYCKL
jgi:hypothetical protein